MKKEPSITVNFRIWFYAGDNKLAGIGRIELLERIRQSGSITNAAKQMKMSYRQAWQMVKEMNERAKHPVVEKRLGGKDGGGAVVTEYGNTVINEFHVFNDKIKQFIKDEGKNIML